MKKYFPRAAALLLPGLEYIVQRRVRPFLHPRPVVAPLRPPGQPPDCRALRAQSPPDDVRLEPIHRIAEVKIVGAEERIQEVLHLGVIGGLDGKVALQERIPYEIDLQLEFST